MELVVEIENYKNLLGAISYDNAPISMPHCSLYQKEDYIEILDKIISKILEKSYTKEFVFNNYHEIIDLNFFEKKGILNFFEKKLNGKLIILDNNVGKDKKGHPFFLGLSHPTKYDIDENKIIKKTFLCMNLHEKPHRKEIFEHFQKNNIFDKTYFSYMQYDTTHPYHKKLPSEENFELEVPRDVLPCFKPEYKPIEEHKTSFCSIVTETMFFSTDCDFLLKDSMFITEKTEKCFSAGHPFIMVSTPFFLKKLKEFGFKTFHKWWNEDYDDETDDELRMIKIKNLITKLSKLSVESLQNMYKEMLPTLIHNQKVNHDWYEKNKNICSTQFYKHNCIVDSFIINI